MSDNLKFDAGKLRMDLIPAEAEEAIAACLTHGLIKHDEESWRKVEPWRYHAALRRHLNAWKRGIALDAESGLPHLWHVLCNAAFLVALEGKE